MRLPGLMEFQIIMRQIGSASDAPCFSPRSLIDRLDVAFRPLFAPYRNRLCIARLSGYFVKLNQTTPPTAPWEYAHERDKWPTYIAARHDLRANTSKG